MVIKQYKKYFLSLWQTNRYIWFFGKQIYYKQYFLFKIAKPLGLKVYTRWEKDKKRRKRARRKQNGYPQSAWVQKKRKLVMQRDGAFCQKCKATDNLTLDHKIPLCILGKAGNTMNNLQILCADCNVKKSVKDQKLCLNFRKI